MLQCLQTLVGFIPTRVNLDSVSAGVSCGFAFIYPLSLFEALDDVAFGFGN